MADPTFAEIWTQAKEKIHWFQELYELAGVDATNLIGLQDAAQAAAEGEYIDRALTQWARNRSSISELMSPANVQASLLPYVLEMARKIGSESRTVNGMMRDIRAAMLAGGADVGGAAQSVNSRNLTLPTPSAAGGNVGDGVINRLAVDKDGETLEGVFLEAKRFEVLKDQGEVDKHEEEFFFKGVEAEKDFLNVIGSGKRVNGIAALSARHTAQFVQNPSFSQHGATISAGSGDPTAAGLVGWTVENDIANFKVHTTASEVYRGFPGDTTPTSIEFEATDSLTQILNNTVRPTFRRDVPYYAQIAWMRKSSATGTLTLHVGSQSVAVDVSTGTNNVWNIARIAIGTANWYDNFREDDLDVKIDMASLAAGTVKVDDLILAPFYNVDGTWYAPVGGATPFMREDNFTFTDALAATEAVIQYWLWRGGFGYLPSDNAGTETITDP